MGLTYGKYAGKQGSGRREMIYSLRFTVYNLGSAGGFTVYSLQSRICRRIYALQFTISRIYREDLHFTVYNLESGIWILVRHLADGILYIWLEFSSLGK